MSIVDINDLRQKRVQLIEQGRSILDAAGDQPDASAIESYEKIEADIEGLNKRISIEERQLGLESGISAVKESPEVAQPEARGTGSAEYRSAFAQYMRVGEKAMEREALKLLGETRAHTIGVNADGGFTVDDEFNSQLMIKLRDTNIMRQVSTVITTGSGNHNIRVANDDGVAAYEAEEAATPEDQITFSNTQLNAHKLAALVQVSEELLTDSAFDLESFIAADFASRFGRKEEEKMTVGTGAGEPNGIITAAVAAGDTVGAALAAAISFEDVIDLFYGVRRVYRNASSAAFLAADTTISALRKIKDTEGAFIWEPSQSAGTPDSLLGRPVYANDFVEAVATTNRSLVFGDLSKYWIADRGNTSFQRLDELYRANGRVGFRGYRRNDGDLIPVGAVKVLLHP